MHFTDKTTRRLAVLGATGALAVGAFALPALAQDAGEDTSESTSEVPGGSDAFTDKRSAFAEALAEALDLPVDRVTDAVAAARETVAAQWEDERLAQLQQRLDDAVADGDLTREQADAIAAAAEAGVLPGGRRFGGPGPSMGHLGMPRPGVDGGTGDGLPQAEDTATDGA